MIQAISIIVRRILLTSICLGMQLTVAGAYSAVVFGISFLAVSVNVYVFQDLTLSTEDWIVAAMMAFAIIPSCGLLFYGWLLKTRRKSLEESFPADYEFARSAAEANPMGFGLIFFLNTIGILFLVLTPVLLIGAFIRYS